MEIAAPSFNTYKDIVSNISCCCSNRESIFFGKKEIKKACYCVIAGDRGLAGGYNSNVFKEVNKMISESPLESVIFPIGKKTAEFFKKDLDFVSEDYITASEISIGDCFEIGNVLTRKYEDAEFDELYVIFTEYKSVLKQDVTTLKIFPFEEDTVSSKNQMTFEPSAASVLKQIMPAYIASVLYNGVAQSYVSELTARQNAMDTATSNADEMLSSLQLQYNRARQAGITQEITEIVAGANS